MQTVIKAENLSKKFKIGKLRRDEGTLRDLIGSVLKAPFAKREEIKNPIDSTELWALRNVSFEVKQGDTLGIVGGNGAGKSTLLKILSRIIKPTTGRARIDGRVGSLLEVGTGFHQDLTGRENVFLNGAILGMQRREVEKKFDEIVAFAEIEKFIDTPVKFYSTGMYLRLAFAVAAHLEPDILILDEVLTVGDAAFQAKCLGKMNEAVGGGRTILFVSHSAMMVEKLCKTALYLKKGRLENFGETKTVLAQYESDHGLNEEPATEIARTPDQIKDDEVRFVEWNILNSASQNSHTTVSNEKSVFEFVLVSRRETEAIRFDFYIRDCDGKLIAAASSVSANVGDGVHRLQWTCESLFNPGYHKVIAEAFSIEEQTTLDVWNCDRNLEVLPFANESAIELNAPVWLNLQRG